MPQLRDQLSAQSDHPAQFTWCIRIDPQIADAYGSATWLATKYAQDWSWLRGAGDELDVHPHVWHWKDRWVADNADADWVAHCSTVALEGFRDAFGETCRVHKRGDGFMTTALARQLDDDGVLVDLTLEPGRPATRSLLPAEETTGWLPDTQSVPPFAYRPTRDDFRVPDDARLNGLTILPLTPGVLLALTEIDSRVVGAGSYAPLWLWRDPAQFREMLQIRLAAPQLTHLAFALRTDTILNDDLWTNVRANFAELDAQLDGRHQWCTAQRAAELALDRHQCHAKQPAEPVAVLEARAREWLHGSDDPGSRERINLGSLALGPGHPLAGPRPATRGPTVSAVVPVYNSRLHLRRAIASVVDQTTPPAELIVVDDGSTDDLDFLHGVAAPFPIRVTRQENAGQSAARNLGARLARGDLVAFLDQDDAWLPEHLDSLAQLFRDDPTVAWAYSDFDEIDAEGRIVTRAYLREHGVDHPKHTLAACISFDLMVLPSASVVRRDAFLELGGFDVELRGFEDDDLYVRAFRGGWQFAFHRAALTRYRVHDDGDSVGHHFAASRRRFSDKLKTNVRDDPRSGRYYFRDIVAPRFFQASLDDYVRAVSVSDWIAARRALRDLRYFGHLGNNWPAVAWKVWVVGNPRLFARLLRLHDALPRQLRVTTNPAVRWR